MFTDLHEGILEVFSDAQREQLIENERRVDTWRYRRAATMAEQRSNYRERVRLEVQIQRALAPRWCPPRPRVVVVTCARCGGPAEKREGVRGLVHRCVVRREGAAS